MRTLLCSHCLRFVTVAKRDAHDAMRTHAVLALHPLAAFHDVQSTFERIIGLGFAAKARR